MQTKLKQLWHVAIQQQVCAGLTAAGTLAALPPSPPFSDSLTQQETVAIAARARWWHQASATWGNTDIPSASAKNSPNLSQHQEGQGRDGALSTLPCYRYSQYEGCSQGQLVACLHSRVFLSWSYSVKLERGPIEGVGANELWWSLKTYRD